MKLQERLLFGIPILLFCFALVICDGLKIINIEKFGYAVIGGYISTLLTFYYRKANKKKEDDK